MVVVAVVAKLFRYSRVDAKSIRNPRGFCIQIILNVAVTGIDGQSRTSDEALDRPMQVRYEQKMAKYGHVAEQNNLRFIPAVCIKFIDFTHQPVLDTK